MLRCRIYRHPVHGFMDDLLMIIFLKNPLYFQRLSSVSILTGRSRSGPTEYNIFRASVDDKVNLALFSGLLLFDCLEISTTPTSTEQSRHSSSLYMMFSMMFSSCCPEVQSGVAKAVASAVILRRILPFHIYHHSGEICLQSHSSQARRIRSSEPVGCFHFSVFSSIL